MLHILYRVVGILHHVVQQRGYNGLNAQTDLVDDDLCHCNRMQEVRLARAASYPLVCLFSKEEGSFDEVPVLFGFADPFTRLCKYLPFALN